MWPEIQLSETRVAAEYHTSAPYSLENSSRKIVVIHHFPSHCAVRNVLKFFKECVGPLISTA